MNFLFHSLSAVDRDRVSDHPQGSVLFICLADQIYMPELNKLMVATDFVLYVTKLSL